MFGFKEIFYGKETHGEQKALTPFPLGDNEEVRQARTTFLSDAEEKNQTNVTASTLTGHACGQVGQQKTQLKTWSDLAEETF